MSKESGSTSDALVPSSGLRGIKVTPLVKVTHGREAVMWLWVLSL